MDSLIFELQIIFYFQLFLSANVRHKVHKSGSLISWLRLRVTLERYSVFVYN